MAKASAADLIMEPAKLKPLLNHSKSEPVQVAIGVTSDGEGVILLHKTAKPKAVLSMLKQSADKAKVNLANNMLRFGRAEVDPDYDPETIRFHVNKEAPGSMRKPILELAKRIPFHKIEFLVDPSLDEEDGESVTAEAAPAATGASDIAQLHATLAALTAQIPTAAAGDAARLATLQRVAAAIEARLKANDAAGAATAMAGLKQALAGHASKPSQPARSEADGAAVRVAKGLLLWNGTRTHVDQQLKKLTAAIIADSEDEPDFEAIKANAGAVHVILDRLDDRLSEKLDALRGTTDPAAKVAITREARDIAIGYQAYVANDPLMNDIDDNGFIPLDIRPRLTATLDAIVETLG